MIFIRKKDAMQELAISLFLMLDFNPDTTARSVINRIRERAQNALQAAESYTGRIGAKDVQHFLRSRCLQFSVCCGADIVKGDVIRFLETVPKDDLTAVRPDAKRGITAEVLDIRIDKRGAQLFLKVIASGSVWGLLPGRHIQRSLRNVTRFEVMRAAWDDETVRQVFKASDVKTCIAPRATHEVLNFVTKRERK